MLKGSTIANFDTGEQIIISAGQIFSMLAGEGFSVSAYTDESEALVFRFYDKVEFCNAAGLTTGEEATGSLRFFTLTQNSDVMHYIRTMAFYCDKGLRCRRYLNNKVGELMHLLQVFYPRQDFNNLFNKITSAGYGFQREVANHITSCKSVYEIASVMNLSVSGFEKKFKKIFGESPYHWMKRQKAQKILHLLCSDELSFKQIANQLEFTSISEFNDFVKRELKQTPGQIRHGHT